MMWLERIEKALYEGVNPDDIERLRPLAERLAGIAALPGQDERRAVWYAHNALQRVRPLVLVYPEGSWSEIGLPVGCEGELARDIEWQIREKLYYADVLQDDRPIEAAVAVPMLVRDSGIGIREKSDSPAMEKGARHFVPVLEREEDIEKIRSPVLEVDHAASATLLEMANTLVGGLVSVKRQGWNGWGISPLDEIAKLRGIDRLMFDLYERPDWIKALVRKLVDGEIARIRQMERLGLLWIKNDDGYTGSGGLAYTRELPASGFDGTHVRTRDCWGAAAAQIFVSVSPEMHEEFALSFEREYLDLFGLNCYGCCEPLHDRLEYVFKVPRLRRISISPWADVGRSAREIGDRYILSNKPNPEIVARSAFDPDEVERDIRARCDLTRESVVEFILRDTHTCRNDPRRLAEWVRVARKVAMDYQVGG